MKKLNSLGVVLLLCIFAATLSGCASAMRAMQHAQMDVKVKMEKSIILDPLTVAKNRNVFVKVTNTSGVQELAFEKELRDQLVRKGMVVVSDPAAAGYIIQANVRYMDLVTQKALGDGALLGGLSGIAGGLALAKNSRDAVGYGIAGALVGGLAGGAAEMMFKVGSYAGVIDLQIREKVGGGLDKRSTVSGQVTSSITQGTSTTVKTTGSVESEYQTYTNTISAVATQTHISKEEAAKAVGERLAMQIAGMF